MTPAEVVSASLVPGTKSVFFLGCFESRVTVYSQQVRALNLADAILDQKLVRETGSVAIVGAGAAGITAAAAFAVAAPNLKSIDLFEQKSEILHLQRNSRDRYLHPHLYDWPAPHARTEQAGLSLLDWHAGLASEVAASLHDQFEAIRKVSPINFKPMRHVEEVRPFRLGGCRVVVNGAPKDGGKYDVVIISIGFGYETLTDVGSPSYWAPSQLAGPIRAAGGPHSIFVSGNGDGGLVDFLIAAFNGLSHREIAEFLIGYDGIEPAEKMLLEIEERAWVTDDPMIDLYEEYRKFVLPLLPSHLWLEVEERLRPDVQVWLHTHEKHLLRRDTAILNRFAVFLAIEADRNAELSRIQLRVGTELLLGTSPLHDEIGLTGEAPITPLYRFLRFGADRADNLEPFKLLVKDFQAAKVLAPRGFRPATPDLTASARTRFQALESHIPRPVVHPRASLSEGGTRLRVRIAPTGDGRFAWSGDMGLSEVHRAWTEVGMSLDVTCEVPVSEAGVVTGALARLCAHAERCELACAGHVAWEEALACFTGRALPGPAVDIRFNVHDLTPEPAGGTRATIHTGEAFAAQVHAALDLTLLHLLHDTLEKFLHLDPPIEIGWIIERQLRGQMWEKWLSWHHELESCVDRRRRFLLLLATEQDPIVPDSNALVRLGPRILRAHLLRAAVFALAFSTCSGRALIPADRYPGNLAGTAITGHATGVAWVDGREIGPEMMERDWTAGLILLSELKAPPQLLAVPSMRLDRLATDPPGIVDVTVAEQPIVIGCDSTFQRAMEAGADAVCAHIRLVIDYRAAMAAATLETTGDSDHG